MIHFGKRVFSLLPKQPISRNKKWKGDETKPCEVNIIKKAKSSPTKPNKGNPHQQKSERTSAGKF
jgi:hypothetical protein